ncbi:MAG: peptide ABC transporter substrate-binding protein [Candidatus Eremiobacteraeota bacterium]|nr:peptide ABC transporter substrate-binding protein [Candidatus Eremiobacteraeota bacterium]
MWPAAFTRCRLVMLAAAAVLTTTVGCAREAASGGHGSGARTLHLAELTDPPSLDPLVTDNADVQDLVDLIHGFLIGADAQGRFFPDLVTEIPSVRNGGIRDGGRTIVYRLRRGVRWQDGVPFDSRDVVFSFAAARDPRNNVPDRSGFDDIATERARGPYEVIVRLKQPYSPALATFFSDGANDPYAILPAHLLAHEPQLNTVAYNDNPIGLGPYRLVSWSHGSRLVFEADPHFRRGRPRIARIDVQIIPDSNSEVTVWQSGALDFLMVRGLAGGRAMLQGARRIANAQQFLSDHYQFNYVMFNVARGPLRDRAVRQAIVRGVDVARIEREVSGELDRPGDGDRLPGQFAYDPSIRQASYDPATAARLLDAAGWRLPGGNRHGGSGQSSGGASPGGVRRKNGVALTLDIVGPAQSLGSERFDVQLQAELVKLGIRAQIKTYQYDQLFTPAQDGGIYAGGRFDLALYGWQPGEDTDHSYLFRCDTRPPSGENYGRICDPRIDRNAALEIASTNPAVQARADQAILRELDAQSDLLFLGFDREALFAVPALAGIKPSVLGHHYWNIDRWYWKH